MTRVEIAGIALFEKPESDVANFADEKFDAKAIFSTAND